MRANRVRCCLLLAATVLFTGCLQEYNLVGRWDAGSSTFHFRNDGLVFYLSPSMIRYQGQYHYDASTDPGIVRAVLQPIESDVSPLSLELQVTFLGPDRIRFERTGGGRKRVMLAARMEDRSRGQLTGDVASAPPEGTPPE